MKKYNNKNCILAIETTSNICGVAIINNNKVIYENNLDKGLNHSITLFENIDNAFKKTKLDIKDIDLIKVSNGPGSFTGLRIGIAAALGLSKPYNTLIEYIDTLDSLAYNIKGTMCKNYSIEEYNKQALKCHNYNDMYACNHFIISMIDAKVNRIYMSVYNAITLKKLSIDSIVSIDELCEILNKYFVNTNVEFLFVGSGAVNYKNIFKNQLKINYNILEKVSNLSASSLAFTNGIVSEVPFINYMLASKAERDRNNNSIL